MTDEDFSWKKEGVRNHNSIGKIVGIPPETLREREAPYSQNMSISRDPEADVVIDQFKEKIRNVLSDKRKKEEIK